MKVLAVLDESTLAKGYRLAVKVPAELAERRLPKGCNPESPCTELAESRLANGYISEILAMLVRAG